MSRLLVLLPILVPTLLFVGCPESDPPDDDAGPEGPPVCAPGDADCDPYDEVNFLGTWSTDLCRLLFDCCSEVDRLVVVTQLAGDQALDALLLEEEALLSDQDACVRGISLALASQVRDEVAALVDDRRVFDRDAAEECFGFVRQAADLCAPVLALAGEDLAPPACARVFSPAVGAGNTCYLDDDCLGDVVTCFPNSGINDAGVDVSLTGTCRAIPALGEACAVPDGACEAGLFCSPISATCEARAPLGALCAGAPCDDEGVCAVVETPEGPAPLCTPRRAVGEPCVADDECPPAAFCESQTRLCLPRPVVELEDLSFDFCLGAGDNRTLDDVLPDVEGELP